MKIVEVVRKNTGRILAARGTNERQVSLAAGERSGWLSDLLSEVRTPDSMGSGSIEKIASAMGLTWLELLNPDLSVAEPPAPEEKNDTEGEI